MCTRAGTLGLTVVVVLATMFSPLGANAREEMSRADTLSYLDQIPRGMKNAQFRAWINDGNETEFTLGEEISFNFSAAVDVYVSIAHVDTHGIVSLFEPQLGQGSNRLKKGIVMTFPPLNSGMNIKIEPPLGKERIYFVASSKPVRKDVFGADANTGSGKTALFQAADSTRLAKEFLDAILASNDSAGVTVTSVDHEVIPRPGLAQYSRSDIVGYFSGRGSRSIANPKLDADIRFESNSATLTREARTNLDIWGESLMHPFLAGARFQIGGHTDDVGDARSNLKLSERRAMAVSEYLVSKFGVSEARLSIEAHGESAPRAEGISSRARAQNRRVEFRQIND